MRHPPRIGALCWLRLWVLVPRRKFLRDLFLESFRLRLMVPPGGAQYGHLMCTVLSRPPQAFFGLRQKHHSPEG